MYTSEKINKLEAEGKLTMRSHFNKWNPLTRAWTSMVSGHHFQYGDPPVTWVGRLLEDLVSSWNSFFLPSDAPWLLWTALLDPPCEPFHRLTQKNRQSLAFCGENPFKVPNEIRSHSRASCWWEVSYQILGKQYMLKKPTKWGIKCFSLADLQWLHHQCSSLHWAWDTGQSQFPVPSSASTGTGCATPPEAIPWSRLACFHWPVLHQHPYDSDAKMRHYLHWNICEESSRST